MLELLLLLLALGDIAQDDLEGLAVTVLKWRGRDLDIADGAVKTYDFFLTAASRSAFAQVTQTRLDRVMRIGVEDVQGRFAQHPLG